MAEYLGPPHPPYYNVPIHPEYFEPRRFVIASISLGKSTTVTTALSHDYVLGQLVRLLIPSTYGAAPLSGQSGMVIEIPMSNQVVLNIDTSENYNAFFPSPTYGPTLPSIIPVGDYNSGQINFGRAGNVAYIPGSFRNVSPQG